MGDPAFDGSGDVGGGGYQGDHGMLHDRRRRLCDFLGPAMASHHRLAGCARGDTGHRGGRSHSEEQDLPGLELGDVDAEHDGQGEAHRGHSVSRRLAAHDCPDPYQSASDGTRAGRSGRAGLAPQDRRRRPAEDRHGSQQVGQRSIAQEQRQADPAGSPCRHRLAAGPAVPGVSVELAQLIVRQRAADRACGRLFGQATVADAKFARQLLEGTAERLARAEEERPGRLSRHTEHGGGLLVAQAVHVVE